MPGDVDIAAIAALFADPARVSVLMSLSDGRALPSGELAQRARVTFSTMSMHLAKLVEYGLLIVRKQGRHRYYRIANPSVVEALEVLAPLAPTLPVHSLRESEVGNALHKARMCYKHLAGELGVALSRSLVEKQVLEEAGDDYILTEAGIDWLRDFGMDMAVFRKQKYHTVSSHIDWSERIHHIAGTFGMAFAGHLLELGWIMRVPTSRAIRVTEVGREKLPEVFGVCLDEEMPRRILARKMSYASI
jgi:DNA-binding transcriptional ArsR family regulator